MWQSPENGFAWKRSVACRSWGCTSLESVEGESLDWNLVKRKDLLREKDQWLVDGDSWGVVYKRMQFWGIFDSVR